MIVFPWLLYFLGNLNCCFNFPLFSHPSVVYLFFSVHCYVFPSNLFMVFKWKRNQDTAFSALSSTQHCTLLLLPVASLPGKCNLHCLSNSLTSMHLLFNNILVSSDIINHTSFPTCFSQCSPMSFSWCFLNHCNVNNPLCYFHSSYHAGWSLVQVCPLHIGLSS